MPDWRAEIRARLAPLRLAPEREAEIVEEVAQHLDDRYREIRASGQNEIDAIAVAWRELEQQDVLGREVSRVERRQPLDLPPPGAPAPGRWFGALWQDARGAARSLRKQPVFTMTVLVALALSIGPTTAIISFGNWMFWRPLAGVAAPSRLGMVRFGEWLENGVRVADVSSLNLADIRRGLTTATGLVGVQEQTASLIVGDEVPRVAGLGFVTGDFFDVLGIRPVAGRTFVAEEDQPPVGAPVVVITDGLAKRAFGSPEAAIDRRLMLNQRSFRIIGVAPPGFSGVTTTSTVEVWMTGETFYWFANLGNGHPETRGGGIFNTFVARLAPGAEFSRLQAELGVLAQALVKDYPADNQQFKVVTARVFPGLGLNPLFRPRMQAMFNVLLMIGGVLLLLGCANVANMLIARAIRREHEVAVRRALGASSWRLLQLPLIESCLLACGGAALGLGLAMVLKQLIQIQVFPAAPGVLQPVPIDLRVVGLTVAAALVVGIMAGLAPAWLSARGRLVGLAGSSATRTTTRAPRLRSGLAAAQLALSLMLLVGALLLVATLRNLHAVDLGFNPQNLSAFGMDFTSQKYDQPRRLAYGSNLLATLEGGASVTGATIAQRAPFQGSNGARVVPPGAADSAALRVYSNGIASNYFDVLGTPVIRGRAFTRDEAFASSPAESMPVILSEALARRLFGEADPIGRSVRLPATPGTPARDLPVVGVVRDVHWNSITPDANGFMADPSQFIYEPFGRANFGTALATVIVRSPRPAGEVGTVVRAAAARLDPTFPLSDGQPLSLSIERGIQQPRLFATMLTWVSVLAFALAGVGLHGLVSQATLERSREFGIRMAIGASRMVIARLVGRYVLIIGSIGTAAGLALARPGTRLVKSMLFGVTPLDPAVYGIAVMAMATIVFVASAWPALRATRVPIVDVLRVE
jgi:predicted permease